MEFKLQLDVDLIYVLSGTSGFGVSSLSGTSGLGVSSVHTLLFIFFN